MIALRSLPIAPGEGHRAGRILLEEMVVAHTGKPMPPIAVTERGKPYFPGNSLHFSISHSKSHVFCALSDSPIGIDAEEMDRTVTPAVAKKILSPGEYAQWQQTIKDRDIAHEAAMREEQEKIRIKRQLTNNINHELKTPVASIQVCLETLLSGINLSEEKRQELIERCYANNERLRRLLGDVSLITRMEDGGQLIGKESVNINNIIGEIADELEIMPEEERFTLHADFPE